MLFDPGAHEPLLEAAWSPVAVEAAIRTIAREAEDAVRGREWWPLHPLDAEDGDPDVFHGIYLGAAGVVWALHRLAQAGLHEPRRDYGPLAEDVLDSYLASPEFDGPPDTGLFLGEGGIALVAWLLSPAPALADRLARLIASEPDPDTLELLWGSPGLLLIADALLERTGEQRWASAWTAIADRLMLQRGERVPDFWTQRLYGWTGEILGSGHGMAGVVAALARRPELLPRRELVPRATAAFAATAIQESGVANWPPSLDEGLRKEDGSIRTQWCHGAPGIVTSLAALPRDSQLDSLLLAGGELTWAAGPLRKGPGLCHGTAGNGFALLKLFTRTGDEVWLARARRFAMHSAAQVEAARRAHGRGRHSLWTGDLGTAVYLQQCLAGTSEMPTIDVW
jgi:lantibiotic modifying enzyme